jgi:hypothetical protein
MSHVLGSRRVYFRRLVEGGESSAVHLAVAIVEGDRLHPSRRKGGMYSVLFPDSDGGFEGVTQAREEVGGHPVGMCEGIRLGVC